MLICGTQDGSIEIIDRAESSDTGKHSLVFATSANKSEFASITNDGNTLDEIKDLHVRNGQLAVTYHDGLLAVWNLNHLLMVKEASQQANADAPEAPTLNRGELETF